MATTKMLETNGTLWVNFAITPNGISQRVFEA